MSRLLKFLYASVVYAFLYLPLAIMAVYSFNASKFSLAWKGFTLDWYRQALGQRVADGGRPPLAESLPPCRRRWPASSAPWPPSSSTSTSFPAAR